MQKKQIKTKLSGPFGQLYTPGIWNTDLAFQHLKKICLIKSKKTAERKLSSLGLFPKELNPKSLIDELNQSTNSLVLTTLIDEARKRRERVLYGQLHALPNGKQCLHVNDARGMRFWIPLAKINEDSVKNALVRLQQHIGKPISFFSHGALVRYVRDAIFSDNIKLNQHAYKPISPKSLSLDNRRNKKLPPSPHLKYLEAESIHIIREAVAEAQNPVMMYSIGKDSGVMLHLARKAFYPAKPPFPLLHIDTRWKFQDMYRFRDFIAKESGMELLVHTNPEAIKKNINPFDHGSSLHTEITKTEGLKQALDSYKFDVVFGGARRDEEKSRAKERIFSFRTASHHWDPKNQRPELWNLYNTKKNQGESIRVFPLSNWTELDIWQYIYQENIPVVPLYFAKTRPVIVRPEMIMMVDDERCRLLAGEKIKFKKIRFRTLGCYPLTGAIESDAETLEEVLLETINSRKSEREGRKIDADVNSSMEKKKQEGYF